MSVTAGLIGDMSSSRGYETSAETGSADPLLAAASRVNIVAAYFTYFICLQLRRWGGGGVGGAVERLMWLLHDSSAPRGDQSRLPGPGARRFSRPRGASASSMRQHQRKKKNRFSIACAIIQDLVISCMASRACHADSCTCPQKGDAKAATFCVASATVQLGTELTLTTSTVQPGEIFLGPGRFGQPVFHRV